MSLRMTYWGDKAETMAWMDSPPCGEEACTGSNAGPGVISNISVSPLPTIRARRNQTEEWLFADPLDELHGQVVPKELLEDKEHSSFLRGSGIVDFKGSLHRVVRKEEEPCDDAAANPCATSLSSEAGFMSMLAKKYISMDAIGGHVGARLGGSLVLGALLVFASIAALVALRVRRLRHPGDAGESASGASRVAASASTSGAGTFAAREEGQSRSRLTASDALSSLGQPQTLTRSGSSCQRLLGLLEC